MSSNKYNWHKRFIKRKKSQYNLTEYQLIWLSWAEGLGIGLLLGWLIF